MNGTVKSDSSQNLWRTPKGDKLLGRGPYTINKLIKEFNLILDPCCSGPIDSLIHIEDGGKFFTKEDDGLAQEWKYNSIFNPPFAKLTYNDDGTVRTKYDLKLKMDVPMYKSAIEDWIIKAVSQVVQHGITAIGILPVYTSPKWFHQYINGIVPVEFINGRVHYTNPDGKTGSPNFDTMLVFWIPRK